jgi:hypothetical protein
MSASASIQPTVLSMAVMGWVQGVPRIFLGSMQLHRGVGLFGDHDRPNMALGGITPKQRLAMAA